ncbi:MAG: amino acid ABC transporter permease [Anaerolineaceae bacterium]|jgi:polar amino acid transport system permease protein|nr:amino acid ABC transporter permease [Anaerolineaceae bacterium]
MSFLDYLQIALPKIWIGLQITFKVSLICLLIGMLIGFPVALARVYGPKWLRWLVTAYVEIFRGTPVLVQLFLIYYGLPQFGITFSAFTAAYLAIGLNSGAYQSEYFRGAIQAISSGQMMAARSIGMTRMQAIRYVIIPQAFRFAIPSWSNEAVSMVKISSIVYLIAVPEMLYVAKVLMSKYYNPMQTYILVGLVYLLVIGAMTLLLNEIERRTTIPGLETARRGS